MLRVIYILTVSTFLYIYRVGSFSVKIALIFTPLFLIACQPLINTVTPSPREDWDPKRQKFLDTPNNRILFVENYERVLRSEKSGTPPPPAFKSWDESWEDSYKAIRPLIDNPKFYVNYIKQRRKELELPR